MSNTMQDQPFQYPSPKTRDPDEPHRHSLSTSVPQDRVPLQSQPIPHRPELSRSESTPQFAHSRPIPIRTHTATHRPTAVRPSVDFASQPGSSRGQSRTMDDDEREELTTKGRKRKRLAKACSACHKNKRRCDGFAPCSNCEFSSRPCLYVNAQGEIIPPPRTRDSSSSAQVPRASKSEGSKNPERGNSNGNNDSNDGSPSGGGAGGEPDRRGSFDQEQERSRGFADPLEAVDRDPSLSQDLIQIFFDRMHPYGSMLHPPTFHQRHYLSTVSPLLLDSIYAMSAHLSLHPALLSTLPPSCPVWARGEAFAERAKNSAQRFIDMRRSGWSEEDHAQHRGTWDETEFVQALYLLSVYFASMRQAPLGLYFLDIAIDIIKPKSSSSIYKPVAKAGSMVEHLTLLECRNRTFWLLLVHDLCASANGRARRLSDQDVYHVPLPGDESHWERYGGGSSAIQGRSEDRSQSAREVGDKRRDGLAVGSGNWSGDEGQIGELGHVIRILSIFSDIMCVANNSSVGTESKGNPAQHEQALKSWALSLPRHLRFDENNLGLSVAKLNSQVHTISRAGWLFCYMHAVAECGMFYLQAALAGGGNSSTSHASQFTAQRQGQAVDNIAVILDSMGQRGRESPLMLFPLLVVSNWHDHLRSAPVPPTPQQMMLDERLVVWWQEATRDWGFERRSTMNHGLYPTPAAPPTTNYGRSLSTSPLVPTLSGGAPRSAPMGLGLFGTSPPMANTRAPESALSVGSSTITLPTPKTGTLIGPGSDLNHRYSTGGLPPPLSFNRPRSNTTNSFGMSIRSPSPPPAHSTSSSARKDRMSISEQVSSGIAIRRLPSLSTERSEIKLPSINIPSGHHTPTILESPFGGSNASMGSLGSVGGFSGIGGQDRWQSMSALFSQSLPSISPRERYLEKERDEYFKRERQRDRQRDRDAEDIDMDGTGQEGTRASGPKDGSWGRDAKRDKREDDQGQDLSPRYKAYPDQDKSYYQTHSRNMSTQHLVSPTSRAWEEDEPREYHPQPRRSSQARPNQEPPAQTSGQSASTGPTSIHSFWDRYKRDPTGASGHAGESAGPVGIAALVSAAEEKSRERESVKVQVEA